MEGEAVKARCEAEVAERLRAAGLRFSTLAELSVSAIRHAMRGPVPGMRVTHLAPELQRRFAIEPVTRDLLCLRAGFHQAPRTHYLPRPDGSDDWILIYSASGRGWVEMQGKVWLVGRREAVLIPRWTPHAYGADPDDPWATYWVHFQGRQAADYARLIMPEGAGPVFRVYRHEEVVFALEQLIGCMRRVHTAPAMVAASGGLSLALGLIQLYRRSGAARGRSADEKLDTARVFMYRNLERRLTLKELAAVACMSPNHFGTLFARRYGNPPLDYFNRLKVQRACELLATTTLSIAEIAEQLGFDDPYYFSRLFRKIMGMAPRAYRRQA